MKANQTKRGFSIIEFLLVLIIGVFLLAAIVLVWQSVERSWFTERIHSDLIGNLEKFAERFKKEITASNGNKMFFYPEGALIYEAISFPIAVDDDDDGFIEINPSDNSIIWDQTIIYHVYKPLGGQIQLKRTVFDPRIDMSETERQNQIDEVVSNGKAIATTPNYANACTKFILSYSAARSGEPIVLSIEPSAREFDGYGPETGRSKEISFGTTTLTAGEHYITFDVTGTSQSGYKLGIDSFCTSPSGSNREAEECTIHSDSGKSAINEDMVNYGSWNANHHLEYPATEKADYINLKFYYDEWIETNFCRCSTSATLIDYSDLDGDGGTTGSKDYVVRLSGYGETWNVKEQVGTTVSEEAMDIPAGGTGRNYRNIISYQITDIGGSAVRFQFKNSSGNNDLHIESAVFFERSDGPDGVTGTKKIITFSGGPSVTISKGTSLWSDWVNMLDINNFNKDVDYLLSFFLRGNDSQGFSFWENLAGVAQSYYIEDDTDYSQQADWPVSTITDDKIYALSAIEVSYYSFGTLTSQIYNTGLDNPAYDTLSWTIAKNNYDSYGSGGLGANLVLKARSNDNANVLLSDNDWSDELSIDTCSTTTGTADISSISGGRYIQFHAEFHSQPSLSQYDYLKSCVLKRLGINWPGESIPGGITIVDLGGYITTRPDYGKFSVQIDGKTLTKGLEMNLTLTKDVLGIGSITRSITTEIEPRNTGR